MISMLTVFLSILGVLIGLTIGGLFRDLTNLKTYRKVYKSLDSIVLTSIGQGMMVSDENQFVWFHGGNDFMISQGVYLHNPKTLFFVGFINNYWLYKYRRKISEMYLVDNWQNSL